MSPFWFFLLKKKTERERETERGFYNSIIIKFEKLGHLGEKKEFHLAFFKYVLSQSRLIMHLLSFYQTHKIMKRCIVRPRKKSFG